MPKGHAAEDAVYDKVYSLLLDNDALTGKELKKAVEDSGKTDEALQGVDLTVRKYQLIKQGKIEEIKSMKVGPLEQPWSVMALPEYPIEAQALPIVLEIWKMQLEAYFEIRETEPDANPPVLSVRQALWISRLYCTVKCGTPTELRHLRDTAYQFAVLERILTLRHGYSSSTYATYETWGIADLSLIVPSAEMIIGVAVERKKFKKKGKTVAAELFSDEYRNERTNY